MNMKNRYKVLYFYTQDRWPVYTSETEIEALNIREAIDIAEHDLSHKLHRRVGVLKIELLEGQI